MKPIFLTGRSKNITRRSKTLIRRTSLEEAKYSLEEEIPGSPIWLIILKSDNHIDSTGI
jgi:hypothetical protein